jgi:hypothetical protein
MAKFTDLPAELRQGIIQYVLYASVVHFEHPDIDQPNPLHWCKCERVDRTTAPAYLHRKEHPMSQFIPYMLVSKAFYEDVRCTWAHSDPPRLLPVLSISLIGFDRHRPMKGALLKWLTPRLAVSNVDKVEWRFDCHDQIPSGNNTGRCSLIREANVYYDFTLTTILESVLAADWFGILPYLPNYSSNWGYWIFKLSTEVDEDVHLASSEYFTAEAPGLMIVPHPFREAHKLKDFVKGYLEYDLINGCDIWVDEVLVYRLTMRPKDVPVGSNQIEPNTFVPYDGVNEVLCEEFDYVMDTDPLLVPKPGPTEPPPGINYVN